MSRYEQIYNTAKGVMNGSIDIELPAISVLTIFVLALMYMVTTSISIDIYSGCDVKGKKLYDRNGFFHVAYIDHSFSYTRPLYS